MEEQGMATKGTNYRWAGNEDKTYWTLLLTKPDAKTKRSEEEYRQLSFNDGISVEGDKRRENTDFGFSTLRKSNLSKLPTDLTCHLRRSTARLAGPSVCWLKDVEWQVHAPWSTWGCKTSHPSAGQSQELPVCSPGVQGWAEFMALFGEIAAVLRGPLCLAIKCTDIARGSPGAVGWSAYRSHRQSLLFKEFIYIASFHQLISVPFNVPTAVY